MTKAAVIYHVRSIFDDRISRLWLYYHEFVNHAVYEFRKSMMAFRGATFKEAYAACVCEEDTCSCDERVLEHAIHEIRASIICKLLQWDMDENVDESDIPVSDIVDCINYVTTPWRSDAYLDIVQECFEYVIDVNFRIVGIDLDTE